MERKCNICGVTSEKATFYKGVTNRCAECHKDKMRENRAAKADYYRSYDAMRYQEDPRVKERHRRYQKTNAGKEAMQRSRKKWLENNADKRAAHVILGNAVRDGRVEKKEDCEHCGKSGCRLEGHHYDYTKPLDVIWLCRKCHVSEHN